MGKGKKNKPGSRKKGAKGRGGKGPKGFSPSAPLPQHTRYAGPSAPSSEAESGRPADRANAQVVMAGVELYEAPEKKQRGKVAARPGASCVAVVPTRDPADRAHDVRDGSREKLLVPAAVRGLPVRGLRAVPRRYPLSQIVQVDASGRGIGVDSMFDEWHRMRARLRGIPGVGLRAREESAPVESRYLAIARVGFAQFQRLTSKGTTQRGADEQAEAMADEMLARAGPGKDGG